MIRVCIQHEEMRFFMDGHACYAPVGQDIVCASASMLAAALFEYVLNSVEEADVVQCEMEPGHAALEVRPRRMERVEKSIHAFEMAKCGFELLAARYPGYVVMD